MAAWGKSWKTETQDRQRRVFSLLKLCYGSRQSRHPAFAMISGLCLYRKDYHCQNWPFPSQGAFTGGVSPWVYGHISRVSAPTTSLLFLLLPQTSRPNPNPPLPSSCSAKGPSRFLKLSYDEPISGRSTGTSSFRNKKEPVNLSRGQGWNRFGFHRTCV